ncbi:MAG: DUF6151 family protein [Pseudomonadota bacterium]
MTQCIPLRCACGKLKGSAADVDGGQGNHIVCYCDDCQAFQHFLGQADAVLDAHGGTRIFQMSPGKVEFTEGSDQLACMRLGPKGVVRWYAACCNTPIGNTLATPALPFVGLICACMDLGAGEASFEQALGPLKCGVHGRFALGTPIGVALHDSASISFVASFLAKSLRWKLRGDHKRSPFFVGNGALRATPQVLTKPERDGVDAARAAWRPT